MADTNEENTAPQENTEENQTRPNRFHNLKEYVIQHKINVALWLTRAITLTFCISYILPFFTSTHNSYHKALISSAASSALRLHQRIPSVQFTREFLDKLIMEDSAHYLFYSIIFMNSPPITMVLVPIFLFAMLHFASFSLSLLDIMGQNNMIVSRFFISLVEFQQRNLLRGAAFVEIFLMPLTIVSLFMGQVSLFAPILYYRFLCMRYSSRRNTYTRTMFYELRISTEHAASRSECPGFLRNALFRIISLISRIGPVVQVAPPTPGQ